ncbi:MAG: 3H domain-containing protein [Bacillota bacterium]
MDANSRREEIIRLLDQAESPVTGSELAQRMAVSRQVIVQDIALLRARGEKILATPQGYLLARGLAEAKFVRTFACQHGIDSMQAELEIMVDHGGRVLDVIVEHPLYGELKGLLMLDSRRDVERFICKLRETQAQPLSALTQGVHLHTVEAGTMENFISMEAALKKAGLLLG